MDPKLDSLLQKAFPNVSRNRFPYSMFHTSVWNSMDFDQEMDCRIAKDIVKDIVKDTGEDTGEDIVKDTVKDSPFLYIEETYPDTQMDDNHQLAKAVRTKKCHSKDNDYGNDSDEILYVGYLMTIYSHYESKNDTVSLVQCSYHEEWKKGKEKMEDKFLKDAAHQTLDSLLLHHFHLEQADPKQKKWSILLQIEKTDDFMMEAAIDRGFVQSKSSHEDETKRHIVEMEWRNPCKATRFLTEYAFTNRGEPNGLNALAILHELCQRRVAFPLEEVVKHASHTTHHANSVLYQYKQLIPEITRNKVHSLMEAIQRNGWLSTNLDSVDMLPSLHINLVTLGKPLFPQSPSSQTLSQSPQMKQMKQMKQMEESGLDFQTSIQQIFKLLQPHLYNDLLPRAQAIMNSTSLEISEVFIRSYGQDIHESTRLGISAHYDVYSSLTSVIALDDVAATGRDGLYTVLTPRGNENDLYQNEMEYKYMGVTNHASLRRYFPLDAGDAVLHSWDTLHGVDIQPTKSRTSLIVWFTDYGDTPTKKTNALNQKDGELTELAELPFPPPWLNNPNPNDDIGNFVLASAIGSSQHEDMEDIHDDSPLETMRHDSNPFNSMTCLPNTQHLYYNSARMGNALSLCKLGSLLDDNEILDTTLIDDKIPLLLDDIHTISCKQYDRAKSEFWTFSNTQPTKPHPSTKEHESRYSHENNNNKCLAKALWFEAAMRGNPLAQISLADACMDDYMECKISPTSQKLGGTTNDHMLMATTLFALAAQQGDESAKDALSRVMDLYHNLHSNSNHASHIEDEMLESPIVKTILLATMLSNS